MVYGEVKESAAFIMTQLVLLMLMLLLHDQL